MDTNGTTDSMSSLARGLLVLEVIADAQPIGVADLARRLDMPKSSVQRTLKTLAEAGWLVSTDEHRTRWFLAAKVRSIGHRAGGEPSLLQAALPHVQWLAQQTQETIHFGVPIGDRSMVVLDRVDSTRPVRTFMAIGTTIPLHASASGKAIMSGWEDARLNAYINGGLDRITPTTLTSAPDFLRQLEQVRAQGYAANFAENREDVFAIGSAVGTLAAVSISMPATRFDPDRVEEWGGLARETCARIGRALG
ncbi:IclR family transcriptional regulator [Antrihabitans sp. YC2-6]|uniref:IclR family transcriptional regulator n=1 Tax=Antrihabitans sp. YC2-6 TaxID=2799498 RepID=UPI001A360CF7|nr:IclR family transcriptional regulator [Antrihabitans sp. YC2-6]MBJ8346953.1 IclR family transcriptional regulator [Antrihabitans sp. YC2-6]